MTDEPARPEPRRVALLEDLRVRLRPLCADWPDELFDAMIARLADVTMKFDGLASPSTYDRRSTDRLVSELREALERSEGSRGERTEPG